MILNDVWPLFNSMIQSDLNYTTQKESAINLAQPYLVKRMIEIGKTPDEFLVEPIGLSNSISQNYVTLPTDFLALYKLWRREGQRFMPFGDMGVMSYSELLNRVGDNYFDSTDTASPLYAAIKEPKCFFDRFLNNTFAPVETITGVTSHATASVVNTGTNSVTLNAISGTFTVGETLTASVSGVISTVASQNTQTFTLHNIWGVFQVGEILAGSSSGATGIITALPDVKTIVVQVTSGTFTQSEVLSGLSSLAYGTMLTMTDNTMGVTISGGTNDIKMAYYKTPDTVTVYDTMAVSYTSGSFTVGEVIYGEYSTATATVLALGVNEINIVITSGTFQTGETITGQTSTKTATVGTLTLKPATLEFTTKYKEILAEACALWWFHLKGSSEVEARSVIVDNMIKMLNVVNQQEANTQWGTM